MTVLGQPVRTPVSTCRLQLNPRFGFRELRELVPYLATLGITDCYLSPIFAPRPGSVHGYDICDHNRLNPELGTREDFDALCHELQHRGMGMILDFVPNHMGIDPEANLKWRSVLENGPSSPFANFFDIDWDPVKRATRSGMRSKCWKQDICTFSLTAAVFHYNISTATCLSIPARCGYCSAIGWRTCSGSWPRTIPTCVSC